MFQLEKIWHIDYDKSYKRFMKNSSSVRESLKVEKLPFRPARGLGSPHLQTILPTLFSKGEKAAPSTSFFIQLKDGDGLYCKISTPPGWKGHEKTVLLLHGLGGSDTSGYIVRMSRKFYQAGYCSVRVNLRGAGEGIRFATRPYHAGTSHDILEVVQALKRQNPESPLVLIGFSLGGNIVLKLLGELGEQASALIETGISICAPIDLNQTMELLSSRSNFLYHRYYVNGLNRMGSRWTGKRSVQSILDFDNIVTAPHWGFCDAFDYYQQCSGKFFLPQIRQMCHLIFACDDPFVDYRSAIQNSLSANIKIWLTQYGGHMGFWGWAGREHGYHWLDALLLKLI